MSPVPIRNAASVKIGKRVEQAKKRLADLDVLLSRLYEDLSWAI